MKVCYTYEINDEPAIGKTASRHVKVGISIRRSGWNERRSKSAGVGIRVTQVNHSWEIAAFMRNHRVQNGDKEHEKEDRHIGKLGLQ